MESKTIKIRLWVCALISILTLWLLSPTVYTLWNPESADKLPSWMPNSSMKLGLDLKGGVELSMGVDLNKVVIDQLSSYATSLQKEGEKNSYQIESFQVDSKRFEVSLKVANAENAKKLVAQIKDRFTVLEVLSEEPTQVTARMTRLQESSVRDNALTQSLETIRNRIDEFGVSEPIISKKGEDQVLVQFPGATDPDRLKSLIGQTAKLNFQIVHECTDQACLGKQQADWMAKIKDAETKGNYNRETLPKLSDYMARLNADLASQLPANTELAFERVRDLNVVGQTQLVPFLLSKVNVLGGETIEDAFVTMDQGNQLMGTERPVVSFRMNSAGTPLLGELTSKFKGYFMAIVLDGIVKSAPTIQSAITGGSGQISVGGTDPNQQMQEAKDTSIVLRAGALPTTITPEEERVIGPSIGRDAIDSGKKSLIYASVFIVVLMIVYYGVAGIFASIILTINIALIFAILGSVGATLTLPGIAGVVLTIGMAVDALIIIFERMREEIRAGRNSRQVLQFGFEHAMSTILDSNVTTAIGAYVLLQFGTGSVRGFALTLLVGIISNVFMATFFAKSLFAYWVHLKSKNFSMGIGSENSKELQHGTV